MTKLYPIKTGAAILAGGKSTRFDGQNKALIKVSGETILERNIQILRSLFDEIHIISNKTEEFEHIGIPVFADDIDNIGPLGGIYTALLHSNCEAVFVFSCDMPFLSEDMIKNIIAHFTKNRSQILIPQIHNKIEPLHAIYATSILSVLENYIKNTSKYKIRLFFPMVSTSYLQLEDSEENHKAFLNINSFDDYAAIKNRL